MNLFFVVEGKRTEKKLYKKWVSYLYPEISFVQHISEIEMNNFSLISGNGWPQYLSLIKKAFLDINRLKNIDHLFICVDSEELTINSRLAKVKEFISNECPNINIGYDIIIQNHCIETWLMGNKKIRINNTTNEELIIYRNYYNVNISDPEGLRTIDERSIGVFSLSYLKLMLAEKGITYSKSQVNQVGNKGYFNQLIKRYRNNNHINSFGYFLDRFNDAIDVD